MQKHPKTKISGESNKNSKLTEEIVLKIRSLHEDGYKIRELSELFKISMSHITKIVKREAWKHV